MCDLVDLVPQTTVIVSHQVPGFHHWPGAPDDVAYLRYMHRHLFLIVVGWKVSHDNRDVEFHTAQDWIRKEYPTPTNFGSRSCEQLAKELGTKLIEAGLPAPTFVEFWEDGEFGARVEL